MFEGTSDHSFIRGLRVKRLLQNNRTSAKIFHVTKKGDKHITPDNPGEIRRSITRDDRPHAKWVIKLGGQWACRGADGVPHLERFYVAVMESVVEPLPVRIV